MIKYLSYALVYLVLINQNHSYCIGRWSYTPTYSKKQYKQQAVEKLQKEIANLSHEAVNTRPQLVPALHSTFPILLPAECSNHIPSRGPTPAPPFHPPCPNLGGTRTRPTGYTRYHSHTRIPHTPILLPRQHLLLPAWTISRGANSSTKGWNGAREPTLPIQAPSLPLLLRSKRS